MKKQKVWFVTGASRGMGLEIVKTVLVGPDAVRRIQAKNQAVAAEVERWRMLSESTNRE